jgi:hypothetical protein
MISAVSLSAFPIPSINPHNAEPTKRKEKRVLHLAVAFIHTTHTLTHSHTHSLTHSHTHTYTPPCSSDPTWDMA